MKKIALISDVHLHEKFPVDHNIDAKKNWATIIGDVKSKNIENIIFGGDIGELTAHRWFFDTLKPFNLKLILGNHDKFSEVSQYYREGNDDNELFYGLEDDYYKYIFLDTSSGEISAKQLNWLVNEIGTGKIVLLFVHHPVIPIDTPIDKMYPLKNRDELRRVLRSAPKEINLFCGHYHMNDERSEDNIKQVISHSSSFQLLKTADELMIDNSSFGYRIIELGQGQVRSNAIYFKSTNRRKFHENELASLSHK